MKILMFGKLLWRKFSFRGKEFKELGTELFKLDGHTLGVIDVAFNGEGNILSVSSLDSVIRSWNIDDGKKISDIKGK